MTRNKIIVNYLFLFTLLHVDLAVDLQEKTEGVLKAMAQIKSGLLSIKNLPKVELHRHLDCSWRYSTLVEIAEKQGLANKTDFLKIEDDFLVTRPMNNLADVLKKFSQSQKVFKEPGILKRLAYEVIEDAYNDGIRILELRYSLNFIAESSGRSYDQIHSDILEGLTLAKNKFPIAVGLISIFQRGQKEKDLKKVLDFTLNHKDTFVGVDLADSEEKFVAKDFKNIFDPLYESGFPITIHSGETPDKLAAQRIKDSVDFLHATRIGHGIQLITNKEILSYIKSKNILLEICPLSNELTQAFVNLKQHPFLDLYQSGILVSINSDDPGIFNTSLSDDYSYLNQKFHLSLEDYMKINTMAYNASFIPEKIKETYWPYRSLK